MATGQLIEARISSDLLKNIFFKNSPLHDGAVLIAADRLVAARCVLPSTERTDIPSYLGTRHRAAIGTSEICDALIIVVSEETGAISLVERGDIARNLSAADLKLKLVDKLVK
jgi:DNA integrity scanning protein DisA with diadenylate cyclase activity